ncbi:MAG: hypothetical protein ACR2NM_03265 [Bythopirellula sp.]
MASLDPRLREDDGNGDEDDGNGAARSLADPFTADSASFVVKRLWVFGHLPTTESNTPATKDVAFPLDQS